MKPDEFEKQLQRQPLRAVPDHWRAEILREAKASVAADVRRRTDEAHAAAQPIRLLTSAGTTQAWWREWLWPSPQAWAGLAVVWLIILALNMTGSSRSSSDMAKQATPVPVDAGLSTQRRELARLLDKDNFSEPVPVPKPAPTGPRSEGLSPSKV